MKRRVSDGLRAPSVMRVQVVRHDDIGEDCEPTSPAGLIQGGAGNPLDRVGTEDRQAISRHTGDGKARRVPGNGGHRSG